MADSRKALPQHLEKIGTLAASLVRPGDRVGLGSGRAALAFVRALGKRCESENLEIHGIATSLLTEQVALSSGVPVVSLDNVTAIDIAVDGADEVDPYLNLLKGGGGNLTREKVVAGIAKKFVIVVGEEKIVPKLGTNFPVFVEVIEYARPVVARKLQSMGGTVNQRMNDNGTPFLTDNGNPYLHCVFGKNTDRSLHDPAALEQILRALPGVVETGLFIAMADEVLVAKFDGTIDRLT
ncbi:MAG TPA: ribose-5-phosphate isomerase RpiA [Phycisphaerae bacterium]|nr:ribose-5-phosphate isomerase RpiA [Phycisphaerae bacterium]